MKFNIKEKKYNIKKNDVIRIELELTNTCNLKCELCYRSFLKQEISYHRSLNKIIEDLLFFKNLKYVTIAGPISEPTLYPYLFELLEFLKNKNIEISLFINGNTHDDNYYRKLALLFKNANGNIYFTMCGSTQELHETYRKGSNLKQLLLRIDNMKKYTNNIILTWIVFNYNYDDYLQNSKMFQKKYNLEIFHTLPFQEHFNLNSQIHLPKYQHDIYNNKIDKQDFNNIKCSAKLNNFLLIDNKGNKFPCNLYKEFGDTHCFECSENNCIILDKNKIYKISESESDTSEEKLRIGE